MKINVIVSVDDDLRTAIRHEYGPGSLKGGRWSRSDFARLFQGLLEADLTDISYSHGQYLEGMARREAEAAREAQGEADEDQ